MKERFPSIEDVAPLAAERSVFPQAFDLILSFFFPISRILARLSMKLLLSSALIPSNRSGALQEDFAEG